MSATRTDALLIARRYATAIFAQAETESKEQTVTEQFAVLAKAFSESAELRAAIANPLITFHQKAAVFEALTASGDMLTQRAVATLANGGRAELVPLVAELLQAALSEKRGELVAQITSARPLTDAVQKQLAQALQSATGKTVQIHLHEDPAVLGGLAIQLGSLRLDATLAGALNTMRAELSAPSQNL